jgi:hypothetical protein
LKVIVHVKNNGLVKRVSSQTFKVTKILDDQGMPSKVISKKNHDLREKRGSTLGSNHYRRRHQSVVYKPFCASYI